MAKGGTEGWTDGWTDRQMDGQMDKQKTDISQFPRVLQDIGPLGPLPKKQGTGAFSVQGIKINRKYHSLPTLPISRETRSNLAELQVQILMRNGMKSICRNSFFLF